MKKQFNLLILGPDTDIGQSVIKIINDHFHYLKFAVPTGLYQEGITLPPFQIAMSMNESDLISAFKFVEVVVSCSKKYSTDDIKRAAESQKVIFIDACCSYPQAVIEAAYHRFTFTPNDTEAVQLSGLSFADIWKVSHCEKSVPFPKIVRKKWCIEQETIKLDCGSVDYRIQFSSMFFAFFFWMVAILTRFIYPIFKDQMAYSSHSQWEFYGKCLENNKVCRFKATTQKIDADLLRSDLAVSKILRNLGIQPHDYRDWNCCTGIKLRLTRYEVES